MTVILIIVFAIIAIFFLLSFWLLSKDVSDALADIRHVKGIFLTFNYTPEEWEYFTHELPLTGNIGKVCFTKRHIYISDGTEEILYEISSRLRKVFLETDFVVYTVRNRPFVNEETGEEIPDSPDNLQQYHILIPKAQQQLTDKLINFYQKIIDKNKSTKDKLRNQ